MADHDQEKTEFQSQKKLEESRHQGELPHSRELGTFVALAVFLIYFGFTRTGLLDDFGGIMSDLLQFHQHLDLNAHNIGEFLLRPLFHSFGMLAPLFGLVLLLSSLVYMSQTGFNIARDKLSPNWDRLNPINGARRIFTVRQVLEGVKSTLKIGLFMYLAYAAIRGALPIIQVSSGLPVRDQLSTLVDVGLAIGTRIAILMAILAGLDFGYQWWEFRKKLRMTHQEMKDEMKEREGNPLIKQRQRSLQMQRARAQMMSQVPKADVVVTNPTHYAVAIAYDREKAPAPYVAAKGRDFMAARIREIAREHNIPIIENKPLARALYRQVKVNQVIPTEFFKAVAEVLAFVFLLKRRHLNKGRPPARQRR